jgi:heat shock protein beta
MTVDKEVPVEEEEEEVIDQEEGEEEGEEGEDGADDDLDVSEEEEDEDEVKPKTKTIQETVHEWKRLNDVKAIWTRRPQEITTEEYDAFYESLTSKVSDSQVKSEGYLDKTHFIAEGEITFKTILYVPKHAARNLYDDVHAKSTNLRLYVRKVLIADSFDDFLPRYLNFVHGIVDSDDLPLNVARETLAQSRVLKVMSKKIVRKVLEMLRKMAERGEEEEDDDEDEDEDEDEEEEEEEEGEETETDETEKEDEDEAKEEEPVNDDYVNFWKVYSKSIKLGIIDDRKNKSKLSKLLRYYSSKSGDDQISLESYVDRMKDDQKHIYYITGESLEYVKSSPFIERLKKKDFEVIYMVDPIDEYVCNSLTEFDGIQLQSVTKDNLKLGDEDKETFKAVKEVSSILLWV